MLSFQTGKRKRALFKWQKWTHFVTSCLETGVKTLVTETGQQLPPSIVKQVTLFWDQELNAL